MSKPRLLDLFCGAGGAGMGYSRAGFEVVGVDIKPMPRYPFEFHHGDALEFCQQHGHEFDAVHASPPCQAFTSLMAINRKRWGTKELPPKLIAPIRSLLEELALPYVIENVPGAPLIHPFQLCGSMFGLRVRRHRLFEASVFILTPRCSHVSQGKTIGVYGHQGSWSLRATKHGGPFTRARTVSEAGEALGIDWMTWTELTQSIPPSYTEFIGRQLIDFLERREAA